MPDESMIVGGTIAGVTVVGASSSFAPTSFARLRLLRQLHACGLLSSREPAVKQVVEQVTEPVGALTATARPG